MNRFVLMTGVCLLRFASCAHAQQPASPSGFAAVPYADLAVVPSAQVRRIAPNIAVCDAGAAAAGTVAGRVFVLRNAGTSPLTIRQLEPSCNCTTAGLIPLPAPGAHPGPPAPHGQAAARRSPLTLPYTLAPGQAVGVNVSVNLAGRGAGGFTNAVFVYVAGRDGFVALLQVRGSVTPPAASNH